MDNVLTQLHDIVGEPWVLTGADMAGYNRDWTGAYISSPLAVVRPVSTKEVSRIVALAYEHEIPVVAMSGNTGLTGATQTHGGLIIALDRMTKIRSLRPDARVVVLEAGVILAQLHAAAEKHGLIFPMTFGAKGSARIGGMLGTNAGGSNVLKYGNMRDLCLGIEVVLPNGEILDLMTELHKDNSGYDLRDLMIGSEGTLGIITAACLTLVERPLAYATAMIAVPDLGSALRILHRLQKETGGAVEAYEYMPAAYMRAFQELRPELRPTFEQTYDVNILVEVGTTISELAHEQDDGTRPLNQNIEAILAQYLEEGTILDATIAHNEAQRQAMWEVREAAAQISLKTTPLVNNDIAVPVDKVGYFIETMDAQIAETWPEAKTMYVAHLGDGNIHYVVWPNVDDDGVKNDIMEAVEDLVAELGGSFSAEHGIGLGKRSSMARRKSSAALNVMRAIKSALDPKNIMNPGKVLPE